MNINGMRNYLCLVCQGTKMKRFSSCKSSFYLENSFSRSSNVCTVLLYKEIYIWFLFLVQILYSLLILLPKHNLIYFENFYTIWVYLNVNSVTCNLLSFSGLGLRQSSYLTMFCSIRHCRSILLMGICSWRPMQNFQS